MKNVINKSKKNWVKLSIASFVFIVSIFNMSLSFNNDSEGILDLVSLNTATVQADGEQATNCILKTETWTCPENTPANCACPKAK